MAAPAESDKGLLDRLNALKPTTVNLEQSSKSSITSIERTQPPSREDALADRLKSLRHHPQSESEDPASSDIETRVSQEPASPPVTSATQPQAHKPPDDAAGSSPANKPDPSLLFEEVDPLATEDQTLDELLAELELDESWLEEVAAEVSAQNEHQRVSALLDEISRAPIESSESATEKDDAGKDDDDSDGEQMRRETNDVLAQAVDAAKLETCSRSIHAGQPNLSPDAPSGEHNDTSRTRDSGATGSSPRLARSNADLDLPAVPSDLKDQPLKPEDSQDDAAFVADIASRMAKLKGLGGPSEPSLPSVPTKVDDFGLPSVPSFSPSDRPVPGVHKKAGYTDEDEKTWCIVCLEDGVVRCSGCDGDVYCARCWKDMHVGPRAGYEERGHQWEKFVKAR